MVPGGRCVTQEGESVVGNILYFGQETRGVVLKVGGGADLWWMLFVYKMLIKLAHCTQSREGIFEAQEGVFGMKAALLYFKFFDG